MRYVRILCIHRLEQLNHIMCLQVSYRSSGDTTERTTLTQHQKFQKAKAIVDKLPSLASKVGMDEFIKRMDTLKQVHDVWAHGGSVIVFNEDDVNIQQFCNENNACKLY